MTKILVIAMTTLVAIVSLALAVPMAFVVATDQRTAFISQLETDTLAAATALASRPSIDWQATANDVAARTGARVVVVDAQRRLVADSASSTLDRVFDRPEIDEALQGLLSSDVRYSQTLATNLRYVAAPVIQNFQVVAAVRLTLPEYDVDDEIQATLVWLAIFVVSVMVAAALIAWLLARSITAPLRELSDVAEALPEDLHLRASESRGPSEVRKVAGALNQTAGRLDGMLERTRRVAADASHHLRTPLTGVRLRLENIEDTASNPETVNEARAAISEVDRLTRRIDQVLALARSDSGMQPAVPTDPASVVLARIAEAEPLADERGVTIHVDTGETPIMNAQPGALERVIDELMANALTYARSRVDVALHMREGNLVLSVADDGPGVPNEELTAVFERFTRGSNAAAGGSGLGLALVQETARHAGGDASAQIGPHGGLEITVTFPLHALA